MTMKQFQFKHSVRRSSQICFSKTKKKKLRLVFFALTTILMATTVSSVHAQTATKQLYLTDPAQGLDRINPADPENPDNSTSSTLPLVSTPSENASVLD